MTDLIIPAIRFEQNGRVFYSAIIPAGELVARAKVDIWEPDVPSEETGYQRAPSIPRKRQIADYLRGKDAVLPAGGFANVRASDGSASYGKVLAFRPNPGQTGPSVSGMLTIPADDPIWVVDMQHRTGGFEVALQDEPNSPLRDFPLAVTIADGFSKLEEVQQFELINTNQKKVRTDLARRLLAIQAQDTDKRLSLDKRGRLWEARGPVVADWLNNHEGVWKDRIMPPNSSKAERPKAVVPETSFVTSLKPILQVPMFMRVSEEQAAVLIARYWEAIAQVFPDAFKYPAEYVIQKTPGVFPFHSLAPEVFEITREQYGDLSVKNIAKVLEPIAKDLNSEFWLRDNDEGATQYGSMKGFRILAAMMREHLPTIDFED